MKIVKGDIGDLRDKTMVIEKNVRVVKKLRRGGRLLTKEGEYRILDLTENSSLMKRKERGRCSLVLLFTRKHSGQTRRSSNKLIPISLKKETINTVGQNMDRK